MKAADVQVGVEYAARRGSYGTPTKVKVLSVERVLIHRARFAQHKDEYKRLVKIEGDLGERRGYWSLTETVDPGVEAALPPGTAYLQARNLWVTWAEYEAGQRAQEEARVKSADRAAAIKERADLAGIGEFVKIGHSYSSGRAYVTMELNGAGIERLLDVLDGMDP